MGNIAPPAHSGTKDRTVKSNKTFLSDALSSKMRDLVETADGRYVTVAQMIAERLANTAMFAESHSDANQAAKLIFERLEGKAAVIKNEEVKPMPKIVFNLNQDGIDKVEASPTQDFVSISDYDGEEAPIVAIDKEQGKVYVG